MGKVTVEEYDPAKHGTFLGGKGSLTPFGPKPGASSNKNSENPQVDPASPLSTPVDPEPLMKGARDAYEEAGMALAEKARLRLQGATIPKKDETP